MSAARSTLSTSSSPAPAHPEPARAGAAHRRRVLVGLALAFAALVALSIIATFLSFRPDPQQLAEQAEASMQAERWDVAQACLKRLERVRTPTPADHLLRARIATGSGDDGGALAELRQIADDPKLGPVALYMTGLIERRHNRLRYAEAAYREAIRRDGRLVPARRELIYILGMQSRRRELDRAFKEMARIAPLNHYDLYVWCLTHFVHWGPDSADELQPYLTADPDDRQTRLAIARLLLTKPGNESRVEKTLAPLPPDDADVRAIRIEAELSKGRVDEAARQLAEADPDDPRLARLRGRIAMRRGDRDTAVREFRRALSDEPYDRVSNAELGKALLLQGHREEAERLLARTKKLDEVYNLVTRIGKGREDQPAAELHRLAEACAAAGLIDAARGWYMVALGQDALDPVAQLGLRRLPATNSQ